MLCLMSDYLIEAAGSLLTAFLVCALLGPVVIPELHKLKFGQEIRDCGPKAHLKKSGTPTMGGLMMLSGLAAAVLVWQHFSPVVVIALVLTFGHAVIGFLDDYIKVVKKRNLGLTAKQKFGLQTLLALAYIFYVELQVGPEGQSLWVPGTSFSLYLGWAYYLIAFLLLVGTTNAVNLTDGLDGLVSCVSIPVFLTFAYIAYAAQVQAMSLFAWACLGSCLGFLIYNHHPAKVFMGDTGSLALGGAIAALALLTHTELLLIIVGAVYVAEAASVIIQVGYFKKTGGKRIFRMTPIHHHFELGGWKETKVVAVFTAVSCLFSVFGLLLWFMGKGGR